MKEAAEKKSKVKHITQNKNQENNSRNPRTKVEHNPWHWPRIKMPHARKSGLSIGPRSDPISSVEY